MGGSWSRYVEFEQEAGTSAPLVMEVLELTKFEMYTFSCYMCAVDRLVRASDGAYVHSEHCSPKSECSVLRAMFPSLPTACIRP